jgi:hypothetical protein
MKKTILSLIVVSMLVVSLGFVLAEVNSVTPSTNEINKANGWAHVNQISQSVGETDLQFVSTRNFYSCFEYRTDGDTSQKISDTNYNSGITDGLYPFFCLNNNEITETILADEYVEVRMVFGAESDERFDWTRFDVLTEPTKADILLVNGVPGKGIANAPGLQKIPKNDNFAKGTANKK